MQGLIVTALVFSLVGVVALFQIEKLVKLLKEKGILEKNFRSILSQ